MFIVNRSKIIIAFFIIVTILLSGHAAQTIFPWASYLPVVSGVFSLLLLVLVKHGEVKAHTILLILITVMVGTTMCGQLFRGLAIYVSFFSFVLTAYLIVQFWSFSEMVNCYRLIMTITTIIALIGYLLVQSTTLLNALPQYTNQNDIDFGYSLIFSHLLATPDRNCGMFWEPGLFATHLAFATVIELLFVEKTDWKRFVLYSVAFFTANSSAGFVLWFLCILLLLVRQSKLHTGSILRQTISLIFVIAAVILILNFDLILQQTSLGENDYFIKLSTDSITVSSRAVAFEHNLKIFAEAPVFGVGFVNAASQMERVADTSTTTYMLSVFGILGLVYTIGWIYGIFKIKQINILETIVLLAIFLIILNKEPHHRLLLSWCWLFYLVGGQVKRNSTRQSQSTEVSNEHSKIVA